VHDFDALRLADLPVDDKQFVEVQSPVTPMSTAQTYAALESAARLNGPAAAGGQVPAVLSRARDAALAVAEKQVSLAANPLPDDGPLFPCDFIYQLQPAFVQAGNPPQAQPPAQPGLVSLLLRTQNKDGAWVPRPKYRWHHPSRGGGSELEDYETSLLARIDVLARRNYEGEKTKTPAAQPYDQGARLWREKPFFYRNHSMAMKPEVSATAYAILSLIRSARPIDAPAGKPAPVIDWPSVEQAEKKEAEQKAAQPVTPAAEGKQ
jgi:hypothetical protein